MKWISVEDRVPFMYQRVLVAVIECDKIQEHPNIQILVFLDKDTTYFEKYNLWLPIWDKVTHWMPLPELP